MMMREIETQGLQWFAVRVKRKQVGGIRKITVGGEFETYRDRQGRMRKRRVVGTGSLVFLPEHLLRRAGFEVFLPVKTVLRRKNRFCRETERVAQPLLADWLFVGWPMGQARWSDLMALDVVTGVMRTGGRPIELPARLVKRLMRQWGGGLLSKECRRYLKAEAAFAVGDSARVVLGPFEGLEFRVEDIKGPSIRGVVDIFGRETPLELQGHMLEANVK